MPTKKEIIAELARLQEENALLKHDRAYGGLTRPALEIEHRKRAEEFPYVVYIDLNRIHDLNHALGEPVVDEMIRRAFSFTIREDDHVIFGRWKSGDEEAFLIKGDPEGFTTRLHQNLQENGLSAISAYAKIEGGELVAAVNIAYQQVRAAKNARGESLRE